MCFCFLDTSSLSSESGESQQVDKSDYHAVNETSEAEPSSASGANAKDSETSADPTTQAELPVTEPAAGHKIHPSAHPTNLLCLSKDEDGNLSIVSGNSQPSQVPEIDLSLIPPPSDFMDEPQPPPEPEKAKDPPPPAGVSDSKPRATVDLELLRQRASTKVSSHVAEDPPNKSPEPTQLGVSSDPHPSPPPDAVEPKSPPAVAPKPKKLPANIILKSHKTAVSNGHSGHSAPTASDRLLMDPQRVRMEALRKLGLLRSDDSESGPVLSPKLSPQSRRSWAAPSSPVSPAPHTPPTTPSYTRLSSEAVEEAVEDASDQQSSSQLPSSRPRTASLGSGKEFSGAQGEGSQAGSATSKEPDSRRSLPAFQHCGDAQKLPRSQGISVLICPHSENGDERREALKRLGLLRD